jgi:hypothetical protein
MEKLDHLTDAELLKEIRSLLRTQHQLLARLIVFLIEVEDRRLDLRSAAPSMFELCTARLGMSEGAAFRRITAARLARRFPVIIELVASGALHLSGLVLLRDYLSDENHQELLGAAAGKSKRQIQSLIAERFPKPDVPDKLRKLPALAKKADGTAAPPALALALGASASAPARSGRGSLDPISPARFKLELTVGQQVKDKLDRARNLLSHANPTGNLENVLERALDALLSELEKKKLAKAKRPRKSRGTKPGHVSREARRETYERDGEQCTWVDEHGNRCPARAFLEIDHVEPRGRGGSGETTNLRVVCAAHNRLWAEQTYGREQVAKSIHLRRSKCMKPPPTELDATFAKLESGLVNQGFRTKAVREVLGRMRNGDGGIAPDAAISDLLRRALLLLSP